MRTSGTAKSRRTHEAVNSTLFTNGCKEKTETSRTYPLMISSTKKNFRRRFKQLPPEIQELARKNFKLWLRDSQHPSLHFKRVGKFLVGPYRPALSCLGDSHRRPR